MIVRVEALSHSYRERGAHELVVLRDVALAIAPGEYVALVGPSGSGKTTLLSVLGALERPQAGKVEVAGHDLSKLSGDELARYRRTEVGFVFQHFGLLAALTALENVELALTLAGQARGPRRRRAGEALERVGLQHRLEHRPAELSGGERQRVAIARALANRPRLILADEPTGNLDEEASRSIGDLLEALRRDDGCTLVLVTHNRLLAARADRRLWLHAGSLQQSEPPSPAWPVHTTGHETTAGHL